MSNNSFIITGDIGAGKSSLCLQLVKYLRTFSGTVGGIITLQNNRKNFYLVRKNKKIPFEAGELDEYVSIGRFKIHKKNLEMVLKVLTNDITCNYFFIDEVGYLEIQGGGYYPVLEKVFDREQPTFVVVKKRVLKELLEKYPKLCHYQVIEVKNREYSEEFNMIKKHLAGFQL
ncbi:MAG: nucleoside-triphosphatase [Candidatus Hodarchaeales archaeon]